MSAANSEQEWFQLLLKRDEKAFSHFYYSFTPSLRQHALGILNDQDQAEIIVNECFMRLWKEPPILNDINHLKNYLFISVRGLVFNFLSAQKELRKNQQEFIQNYLAAGNLPDADLVEDSVTQKLNMRLDELPPECKKIFLLRHMEGVAPAEIATELKITVQSVYNQLKYAISMLRKGLTRDDFKKKN